MTFPELFTADVRIERDIPYAGDSADARHRLDVYAPRNAAGAPVVVFLYGGGWRSGDKRLFEHLGRAFAVRGIVAAVPNYRLTPLVRYPAHADDCALACSWVQRNIAAYGGDPMRLVLMGHSAGAHIATMLVVDSAHLAEPGFDHSAIRGAIPVSGVYDLLAHVDSTVFTSAAHVREAFGDRDEDLAAASPLTHIRSGLPPFLVVVAENDPEGLRVQAREFCDAVRDVGGSAMFVSVKGRDHLSIVRRFGPTGDTTATAAAEFIHHVTAPTSSSPLA